MCERCVEDVKPRTCRYCDKPARFASETCGGEACSAKWQDELTLILERVRWTSRRREMSP